MNIWKRLTYVTFIGVFIAFVVLVAWPQAIQADGPIPFIEHVVAENFDGAQGVYAVDLDSDTDLDILGAAYIDDKIVWWENDGSENFTEHIITESYSGAYSVYAIDLDEDGDTDILSVALIADDITWWENDGSESFSEHTIDGGFDGARSVYAIDIDSDDDVDVLGAAGHGGDITWWENNGSESFTKRTINGNFDFAYSAYAIDVDDDDDVDVLGAASTADDITWWENDSSESFTEHTLNGDFNGASSVYATDIDGDGDVDILGTAQHADDITWWENDGSENFIEHTINEFFDGASSVYATDIDGDGDVDILGTAQYADDITWWENDGSENFTEYTINGDFDEAEDVYAIDIDGDGDVDILGAAYSADSITWWEQIPTPAISISDVTVQENYSVPVSALFTVTLSFTSPITITVEYATADGSAVAPTDYVPIPTSTLTFAPEEITQTIAVTIQNDTEYEPPEIFWVQLANPDNAVLGDSQGEGTILNDATPVPIVGLTATNDSPTYLTTTTTLSASIISGNNITYTWSFGDGEIGNGMVVNHTYPDLGEYTAVVTAANSENTLTATTVVSITEPPLCQQYDFGHPSIEYYIYSSGRSWNFTAPYNLNVASIETSSRLAASTVGYFNVAVRINGNTVALWPITVASSYYQSYNRSTSTSVNVQKDDTVTYFISAVYSYGGVGAINYPNYVKLCGLPKLSIDDVSIAEGDSGTVNAVFNVTLSATSTEVISVEYATADDSAAAPTDYTAIPTATLVFAPGESTQLITVNIQGDTEIEPDETFWVNLANPVNAYLDDAQGQGAILNDDTPNQAPNTPGDPTPSDGVNNISTNQVLNWHGGDPDGDVVTYTVAFGAVNPPPVAATGVTTTTYTPATLSLHTTYYWLITATDGLSTSVGATWSFTTTDVLPPNQAPYTPSDPDPSDGTSDVPTNQVFNWHGGDPDGDVVTYTVAFGAVNPPPMAATTIQTNYTPSLVTNTTYYWIITATDGLSASAGSTWQFTTTATSPSNQAPNTPSDPDPPDGANDIPTNQVLSWSGGDPDGDVVTYTVAFGAVNPPPMAATTIQTNYMPSLVTNTTYYWSITATDDSSISVGPVWRFTTSIDAPPSQSVYLPLILKDWPVIPDTPSLYSISSPEGHYNYTVSWNSVSGATSYTLEEDDNDTFSSPNIAYLGSDTSTSITGQDLGTYYYRVRASNDFGSSDWSNIEMTEVTQEPPPPDFALQVQPSSQEVMQGQSVTYTVAVTGLHGFAAPVALAVGGAPTDTTVAWTANPLTPTADTTLTITPSVSSPTGTFTLVITGTGGGQEHSTHTTLVVVTQGGVGPQPGYWSGGSASFRVESDQTRITNFAGSFSTPTCGSIDVPGDLTPPSEIPISDNNIHIFMNIPDTLTYLIIDGTFNTETSIEGLYSWGVDGCGFGLTRIAWSASWQSD